MKFKSLYEAPSEQEIKWLDNVKWAKSFMEQYERKHKISPRYFEVQVCLI